MSHQRHILILVVGLLTAGGCSKKEVDTKKDQNIAKIYTESKGEPISKYIYGMFIEPLGNVDVGDLIDDGLWAELLDDRKFFYPVDRNDTLVPVNKRNNINQWIPVNDPSMVVMDSVHRYVGVHSPKIITNKSKPEGISQPGLAVLSDKKYVGRLVLSGSPGVAVTISLVWGDAPEKRVSYKIDRLTNDYKKYHFTLDCRGASENAALVITGTGEGSFSVGAASLMPADNIDGFRPDVIRLLNDLNSGIYRWGGNMSSGYDWRDGIGDPDLRAPRYEYAWDAMENNDVGTHELVKFAELINVELSLTVNAGLGDAYSAGKWVEYVNGSRSTPMGKLRAENGHLEPFGIKLWCVGNESYGWWQLGHTDLKSYIIKHNMFAQKMLEADPTIKLIASGASVEEMTITGSAHKETGKVVAEYDSASDWSGGLLRHAQKNIDFMSEHLYCAVDQRFDINAGKYVNVEEPLVDWTRRPANRIRSKVENYNEYHKRIPGSEKIPVYIDEWAYFTNWVHPTPTLGVTIGYARGLHEMFRNSDLIKMAGFTFGTSCLSFSDTDVIYNSSGLLFKLYQSRFGTIPVRLDGNSPQPSPRWPGPPTVNAGGNTFPLDVVAALTSDQKFLTIAIVNPTETPQSITIQLDGTKISGKVRRWTIYGNSVMARNVVGKPAEIALRESDIDTNGELTIEKASINIYRYEIL